MDQSTPRERWQRHLERIEQEGIGTRQYARREGLAAASLYRWRSRLKAEAAQDASHVLTTGTTSSRTTSRFIALQLQHETAATPPAARCTLELAAGVRLAMAQLPEPTWLARLVACMAGA